MSHMVHVHKCIGQYVAPVCEIKKKKKDDTGMTDLDVTSISAHICEVWSR